MKKIIPIKKNLYHVASEPGDCTRYDYFVFQNGDDFSFMPCRSPFKFPQRLNAYDISNLHRERELQMAEDEGCNLYTLQECIRTIKDILKSNGQ